MAGGGRWCKAAASRRPHPERPRRIPGNSPGPSGLGGATAWPEHGSHRALGARRTGNVGKKSGLAGGGRSALQPVALARGRELSKDQLSKGPQLLGVSPSPSTTNAGWDPLWHSRRPFPSDAIAGRRVSIGCASLRTAVRLLHKASRSPWTAARSMWGAAAGGRSHRGSRGDLGRRAGAVLLSSRIRRLLADDGGPRRSAKAPGSSPSRPPTARSRCDRARRRGQAVSCRNLSPGPGA